MLAQVVKGFTADGQRTADTFHLVRQNALDSYREAFASAQAVLLGFPLYTDAMPGIVKSFIEFINTETVILSAIAFHGKRGTCAPHSCALINTLTLEQTANQAPSIGIAGARRVYYLLRFNSRNVNITIQR